MNDASTPPAPARLTSIDAYRGLVMFLMLAEVLHLQGVANAHRDSALWKTLAYHQSHVEWVGCSIHDLIQPSFSFLVGVALPFSLASRLARGQSRGRMVLHAFWRALTLVFLGIFLRSMGHKQTNFTFEDTLTQIGLGYPFLFLLGLRPPRDQWIAIAVILVGYWAAFALYPLPGESFDYPGVGVKSGWGHLASGFAAHWNKNSNPAWAFDHWFLNLFPRENPFAFNAGGYATLSFIPTLATMLLGLRAGDVLRGGRSGVSKIAWLAIAGAIALLAGMGLGAAGICPVVKRIWTPSWVLYSGGCCFFLMLAFYALSDFIGWRGWTFPPAVIGMNSIAAYLMSWTVKEFIEQSLRIHFGRELFRTLGPGYESLLQGGAVLLVIWLVLFWMYRRRIFLRI